MTINSAGGCVFSMGDVFLWRKGFRSSHKQGGDDQYTARLVYVERNVGLDIIYVNMNNRRG